MVHKLRKYLKSGVIKKQSICLLSFIHVTANMMTWALTKFLDDFATELII